MRNEAHQHKVISVRELSLSAYVLRFERQGLVFEPGQYIHVGLLPGIDRREYSVYSSPRDDYLEILVKEIPQGEVSPKLRRLEEGDLVDVEGPFGFFCLEEGESPYLFIATGTGISPFHSITRHFPLLDYQLIHGVREASECYDYEDYPDHRIVRCFTRASGGDFSGRVTDWLRGTPPREDCMVYLCGNCDMIYEVYDILGGQGIAADRIHAEVYF